MILSAEELLAGNDVTYEVSVPPAVLQPSLDGDDAEEPTVTGTVRLRPLTVRDVQLIARAAKDDEALTSVLMIQRALVEPALEQSEVASLRSGLVGYLVGRINRISGLSTDEDEVQTMAESPLVRAFFVLAKEFNWTPQQVREMTVGQILGYLELLNQSKEVGG